jgi:hypothetical protein
MENNKEEKEKGNQNHRGKIEYSGDSNKKL